jgi:hypothetical protein
MSELADYLRAQKNNGFVWVKQAHLDTLTSQRDKLVKALEVTRADLVALGWEENGLMIERIDAALSQTKEGV